MFLQDGIASKGVEPFREERSQFAAGHEVDVEERQQPIPEGRERPHVHNPPDHLIAARRSLPEHPVEPADEKVSEVDGGDVRAIREEEDEQFVIVGLARQLRDPPFDCRRH